MEGNKYGKWTVVYYVPEKKPGKHFMCICKCGTETIIPATTLRAGRSSQCKKCMYLERDNPNDMIGKKYGKWTVIKFLKVKNRYYFYKTRCECGVFGQHYSADLRSGKTKQCVVCHNRQNAENNKTHGMHKTSTYRTWSSMIHRCTNENATYFNRYGGRGISVCDEWRKFENFLSDMGEKPKGLTLDRIDNNGNYEKSNCRWVTHKENCNNRNY